MKVYRSELPLSIDVDDTLVIWPKKPYEPGAGKVKFINPNDDKPRYLVPHQKHIQYIKTCCRRGYQITVWSADGYGWAEAVVRALKLTKYITKVEGKPIKMIDDLPTEEAIGKTFWLENIEGGKKDDK